MANPRTVLNTGALRNTIHALSSCIANCKRCNVANGGGKSRMWWWEKYDLLCKLIHRINWRQNCLHHCMQRIHSLRDHANFLGVWHLAQVIASKSSTKKLDVNQPGYSKRMEHDCLIQTSCCVFATVRRCVWAVAADGRAMGNVLLCSTGCRLAFFQSLRNWHVHVESSLNGGRVTNKFVVWSNGQGHDSWERWQMMKCALCILCRYSIFEWCDWHFLLRLDEGCHLGALVSSLRSDE